MSRTIWTPQPWPSALRLTRMEQDHIATQAAAFNAAYTRLEREQYFALNVVPQDLPVHISVRNMNAGRA